MPTTLLRPPFLAYKNRLLKMERSTDNLKRDALMFVVAAITMLAIYAGFTMIFGSFKNDPVFSTIIPAKIIELLFYAYFILLILTNTVAAVGNIYVAENMDFYLSTPVSSLRLYLAKLAATLAETTAMFFVFSFPAAMAYVHSLDLGAGFFFAGLGISIPFLIIPAGIGVVLGTIFVRFASAFWRRGSILIISIIGLGIWGVVNLVEILTTAGQNRSGPNAFVKLVGIFENPNPIWLPSRWAADLLNFFVNGSVELAELKMSLLAASALGSVALGYLCFDFFALRVRSTASLYAKSKTDGMFKSADWVRALFELIYRALPLDQQRRGIILKDLSSLVRNRAQSLQLILFLGIAVTYIVVFRFSGFVYQFTPIVLQLWRAFLASVNILFAGFIMTAVMTRLVYPSVSLEGKAFWILRVSPIKITQLVSAKYWCWLPLTSAMAITLILAGGLAIEINALTALFMLIIGISLGIGCTGLAIGLGAIFASFEWESPNQISVGLGTLMLLLSSLTMVVLISIPASALSFLVIVPRIREILGPLVSNGLIGLSVFSIVLLNLVIARMMCRKGSEALAKRCLE